MRHALIGRSPYAVAAAAGAALVVVALAASQPTAMRAADELVTMTSPVVTEASVERMRADLDRATAVADAIEGPGIARLGQLTGRSPAALRRELDARDPRFADGAARLGNARALADAVIGNLERRRQQFVSASELPGLGLTLRDAAWLQLLLGGGVLIVGVVGFMRPRRRLAAAVLCVGAALVAAPLALGHPGKTSDTDALLNSLRPFTIEKVRARADALTTARTVFDAFRSDVLPRVAAETRTAAAVVAAELEATSPQLSSASLAEVAVILDRFDRLVDFSARIQPLLTRADELSARTAMWLTLVPGALLVVAGVGGLLAPRARPAGREPLPP